MTDLELTLLAAKAIGATEYGGSDDFRPAGVVLLNGVPTNYEGAGEFGYAWVPLDNSGEALELAAELYIHITISEYHRTVCRQGDEHRSVVAHNDDRARATRRAIVMAAAAVGEAML